MDKGDPRSLGTNSGTNELNIHSSGNLSLNKVSLNVCRRFQTLIPTSLKHFYSKPRGPTCFPDFHAIHGTPHLFNLRVPHWTLYFIASVLSLHSFSTFIRFSICSFQILFRTSTLTLITPLSSSVSPALCLVILNSSRISKS